MFKYYIMNAEDDKIIAFPKTRVEFDRNFTSATRSGIKVWGCRLHMIGQNTYNREEKYNPETKQFEAA